MKPTLTKQDYQDAAALLGCEVTAIMAVAEVESAGSGFLPDGRPKILFEGHLFSRATNRRFDATHPTISHRGWTKAFYRLNQYKRLEEARALDEAAALSSASWGKFQILGLNFQLCGFDSVQSFVAAMQQGEREHLMAFVSFVKSRRLDDELRDKRWADFARVYNGPSFHQNQYDQKMARAYAKYARQI